MRTREEPAHFVLTRAHPGRTSRSVTHPQISPNQTRLTSEFFRDRLPEKKLQLIGMSILYIILSPEPGCHILTPLRDRCHRRSIPSQERPLLATSCTSSASSPCATSVLPVPTVPVPRPGVQCQRCIPDACALTRHAPVLMPPHLRPYVAVKPQESALIPFCNVPTEMNRVVERTTRRPVLS